ncbi:NAD(+) diphosphatase [Neomegalonema sp.]|uniref:NAD(+) diphosphatase n=1 Tax=Neomegalonema sp. TaxID=2039713 RepID=UPI00262ADD62|nr:NAD(+) diphosphatase [Neomegalonema sp.]MDD2869469.1 NAD(+) diphosphatase [Neomegalonema sp.]
MAERDFTGGLTDRAAELRASPEALEPLLRAPEARLMAARGGDPLLFGEALAWTPLAPEILALAAEPPTLMGRTESGAPRFALDLTGVEEVPPALAAPAPAGAAAAFAPLREAATKIAPEDLALAGCARSLFLWRNDTRHCARCGGAMKSSSGGWRRDCQACGHQSFPRTDPVVIMLVERGERCLLARRTGGALWASVLAGFVEPGETVEEAVRREVAEESGQRVGRVSYVASQPWPFGGQLMIGCLAESLGDAPLKLELEELRDGVWATRAEVARAIAGRGYLQIPPSFSIAHKLLKLWSEGRIGFR